MDDPDHEHMSVQAKKWLARYTSSESRAVSQRCIDGSATAIDRIDFAMGELREAMEVLPPSAPHNGRGGKHGDGFHAGCCALRAWVELNRLKRSLQERDREQVSWLIEWRDGQTKYWICASDWTYFPSNATRFCRMSDAAAVAGTINKNTFVAEHVWLRPKEVTDE